MCQLGGIVGTSKQICLRLQCMLTGFVALQIVVFLYLLDNDTSFVILASSGIGLLIEFWKITKAMDVSIDRSGSFPMLRFKDKAGYSCAPACPTRLHNSD